MDTVYGSAQLKVGDKKVRQPLPGLLDRMYEDAGTLGMVMNVLDPANRAVELGAKVRDRITEVRMRVARRVISISGTT
jgi:hypothetical protein